MAEASAAAATSTAATSTAAACAAPAAAGGAPKRDYDHLFKLVLAGDTLVGKSDLFRCCESCTALDRASRPRAALRFSD